MFDSVHVPGVDYRYANSQPVLRNSVGCENELGNILNLSRAMMKVLERGESAIHHYSRSPELRWQTEEIDQMLRKVVEACHGPIPPALLEDITASQWISGLHACHHRRHIGPHLHFGGEICVAGWNGWLEHVLGDDHTATSIWNKTNLKDASTESHNEVTDALVSAVNHSLWCSSHLEFPLTPYKGTRLRPRMTIENTNSGNRRIILLALTLGERHGQPGAYMGCNLARTAIVHGWDIYFVTGKFTGTIEKYDRAMDALSLIALDEEDVVVFVDSADVLVQQTPEHVLQTFQDDDDVRADFMFSGEHHCFPMGGWPYSLGLDSGRYVCQDLFPKTKVPKIENRQNTWVNTGGWIARVDAASHILRELQSFTKRYHQTACYTHGSDQLLGNILVLRHNSVQQQIEMEANPDFRARYTVEVDTESKIFISSPIHAPLTLRNVGLGLARRQAKSYCQHVYPETCPSFIHFEGGNEGRLTEFLDEIMESRRGWCRQGRLNIVDLDKHRVDRNVELQNCTSDLESCE